MSVTTLACKIPSSPSTLRVLAIGFSRRIWRTASECTVFGLGWSSKFCQPERNSLNRLAVVLWSTGTSSFELQMFQVTLQMVHGVMTKFKTHTATVPELDGFVSEFSWIWFMELYFRIYITYIGILPSYYWTNIVVDVLP